MDRAQELFKELTEATGVPGFEGEIRAILTRELQNVGAIETDRLGSFICRVPGPEGGPRVMVAAHMDEIGFMVKYISKEGFIRFVPLGGWWDQVVLSQRVTILTSKGPILGITGAKPPHLLSPEERKKLVEKKDMYIDVGARSDVEVTERFGIRVGDPIVPTGAFTVMADPNQYLAKALDNRFGVVLMVETLQRLAREGHPNTLYGVGTVQEEVGLRGAVTSANLIQPDVAVVFDVEIAGDVPGIKPEETPTRMGGGPVLSMFDVGAIPNLRLRDLVIDTAQENSIPLQFVAVEGGRTDQAEIQLQGAGVPSVAIGVAVRHIHSNTSILNRGDYDQTLALMVAVLKKLDKPTVAGLLG